MNGRELMLTAIEGKTLERFPVIVPYVFLSNADHWTEVTGEPVWKFYEWAISDPDTHAKGYLPFYDAMPFDVFQPFDPVLREDRECTRIIHRDGRAFYHDKRNDSLRPVPERIHEAGSGGGEPETRFIRTKHDIPARIPAVKAETLAQRGINDNLNAALPRFQDKFTIGRGVVNTFYGCVAHVGMTNFFCMLKEEPELIHEISKHILDSNIEAIRAAAMTDCDAIYIDDATATCDMISVGMYEQFSLPYLTQQVKEIKRLGKKAVLIYFGGIADRVEQIVSTGVDLLMMEASMKGYVNDYAAILRQINGRCCLAGNLNPYDEVERLSDADLQQAVKRQAEAGRRIAGRHITSTGSPLTPGTPVRRIADFIRMGREA